MSRTEVEGFKPAPGLAMVHAMQGHRPFRALVLIGVVAAAALTLAGCGRKSGLDLPPSAAAAPAHTAENEAKSISPISKPEKPQPRVVPKRSLPIDILLD